MALRVALAAAVAANVAFRLVVPGDQHWTLYSVRATLSRAAGGVPTRKLQLTITDGTTTVVASPCADAGTEPGTLTATWANASPSAVASGSTGVALGPLAVMTLAPGYNIVGTVLGGTVTDQWTSACAWYDDGVRAT